MSEASIAALVALGVALGLRLIDYMLPKGRHWKWVGRYSDSDDDPDAT